jgi:hypothetical protein
MGCTNCKRTFELPSLGESTYGELLVHGERGIAHRYVCLFDHPVWDAIETFFRAREPIGSQSWFDVLASLADPVDGEHLQYYVVCPHCQADASHFRTPKVASKTPRIGEVEDAAFDAFLALSEHERRQRVVAAAGEA